MSGECDQCGEHALECNCELSDYSQTLKTIFNMLDNLKYECESREYTLNDDEMGDIFYCRDAAWNVLKKYRR